MKRSIEQNVLFGALKSGLTYAFLIAFYRIADDDLIGHYIDYEIGLAFSILLTCGLQSRSYKQVEFRGLHLVGLVCAAAALPATAYSVANGGTIPVLIALVLLDRQADVALQGLRQQGRFLSYNLLDLGNQTLTKAGFLMAGLQHDLLPLVAVIKLGGGLWWLSRQMRTGVSASLPHRDELRKQWPELKAYAGFDIVNYSSGNLDLIIAKAFAPSDLLLAYFYVRKFLRLPLIFMNYTLDPTYIGIRRSRDHAWQLKVTLRLWRVSAWAIGVFSLLLVPVLYLVSNNELVAPLAFALFSTSSFYVGLRMIDFIALLNSSQVKRMQARAIGAAVSSAILISAALSDAWTMSLALMPLGAYVVTDLFWRKVRTREIIPIVLVGFTGLGLAIAGWPAADAAPIWLLGGAAVIASFIALWLPLRSARAIFEAE